MMTNQDQAKQMMPKGHPYRKLLLMLLCSFVMMYLIMFLNVDDAAHIYLSITRTYMSLLMVTGMVMVMVPMMIKMYPDKQMNRMILISAALGFVIILVCLRQQVLVGDREYMKGMIPHHSSAIMTSRHANIQDPAVKKLSEQIIKSQEEEIAIMKEKLAEMNR